MDYNSAIGGIHEVNPETGEVTYVPSDARASEPEPESKALPKGKRPAPIPEALSDAT